jgi:hypothetical protein
VFRKPITVLALFRLERIDRRGPGGDRQLDDALASPAAGRLIEAINNQEGGCREAERRKPVAVVT